jgi:outer membrane receptor protein involved in Fe transport
MRRINPFILSTVSIAALAASPAFAQGQTKSDQAAADQAACNVAPGQPVPANCTPAAAAPATTADNGQITVTGTRIRRPNLESPLPVTTVGGQEFFQTGNVSVGDKLAELPSIRSTFTQANSTRFLGTAGLSLLDLRGLGTVRTLVLVNGRRHVGGDVLSSGVTPDVNTIPTDLIDRVDVVTGGNSAVYGSDAIAGVVNFVLKDHYEGLQLRGQGGISRYSDGGAYFISGLAGKNFAGGRGNVAVNVEYARQEQMWGSNRPFESTLSGFFAVDSDPAGLPNGSDGVPDSIFLRDVRMSPQYSLTGLTTFGGSGQPLNCGTDPTGVATNTYNCPFMFTPTGNLVPVTGVRGGLGPRGFMIGGNGENFRSGHQFQLTPRLERWNINLVSHFDISPALTPFVEAKWSHTKTLGSGSSGPAFINGAALSDPEGLFGLGLGMNREQVALNNPYMTPQALSVICAQRTLNGQSCANLNTRISIREVMEGLGNREEEATRDTYRIVGGVKGDFNGDWHYEVSGNYGRLDEKTKILGNLDVQRFLLANDAVRNASGQIVCRSQVNPAAAIGYFPWVYLHYYGASYPGADPNAEQKLASDVSQCTPINVMGGNFTDAQRAYLLQDTTSTGHTRQLDFTGFVSGDTSKFLNLPGGPVGIVLGAEYREDNLRFDQDPLVQLGYTFYNAIPTFKAPKSKVKEGFGEISVPILKDLPFVHELEVDAAARVSHYNLGTTGTVWAYNVNGIYSPIDGLRLRGNYARAVRAPNQSELFTPEGQNFAPGFADPCSARNIGAGTPNRATNCAAAGRPGGTSTAAGTYDFVYSNSLETKLAGNTNLREESSNSLTLGGVVTPKFLPGFSVSVDYYNIKVKNVITSPTVQQIVNACYDLPDLNNQFCAQFQRNAGPGTGPRGEQPFRILEGSLVQQPLNYAALRARGIDTEVAYRHQIGDLGRLDTRLTWTHVLDRSNSLDPTNPGFRDRVESELGDPQDAFNWNTNLTHGRFTLGYQMRYISRQVTTLYEDYFSYSPGCTPSGACPPNNADAANIIWYPSRFYHDVRLGVDVGPKFNFYVGVDNLTNTKPPLGLSGIGAGSAIYDNRGRFYYSGLVAKF